MEVQTGNKKHRNKGKVESRCCHMQYHWANVIVSVNVTVVGGVKYEETDSIVTCTNCCKYNAQNKASYLTGASTSS